MIRRFLQHPVYLYDMINTLEEKIKLSKETRKEIKRITFILEDEESYYLSKDENSHLFDSV